MTFDDFKTELLSKTILDMITSGTPPSKHLKLSHSVKNDESILKKLMGKTSWHIYSNLSKDEKKKSLDCIETVGDNACKLVGCVCLEDWDGSELEFNFDNLSENYDLMQKIKSCMLKNF
jgi:hypothetical protein